MSCPHCDAEMEHIDGAVEGMTIHHLRLCPVCYLVAWDDEHGIQIRQGVPMPKHINPPGGPKGEC